MLRTYLLIGVGLLMACQSQTTLKKTANERSFQKIVIHPEFIAEGIATGDVNQDGQVDILSGAYWFEAPNWTPHEIMPPASYDFATAYSNSFLNFATDVNQDGWVDLIRVEEPGQQAWWYANPQNQAGHWAAFLIDSNVCNESPMLADLDGNGRMDLVFGHEKNKEMRWFSPPENGTTQWESQAISQPQAPGTYRYDHGLGQGDLNGDGRQDILIRQGWWEAPEDPLAFPWTFHEVNLGEPCSQMFVVDIDEDGDRDVLSASAHAYGIWWHEQGADGQFTRHLIDSSFSQSHGATMADINGDGQDDFITGKRFFAHNGNDPGSEEPAVLYWIEWQKNEQGSLEWTCHLVDEDSGVGLQVVAVDLNQDGKMDLLSSNKKGVHLFLQK